jgi:hypothetical protein
MLCVSFRLGRKRLDPRSDPLDGGPKNGEQPTNPNQESLPPVVVDDRIYLSVFNDDPPSPEITRVPRAIAIRPILETICPGDFFDRGTHQRLDLL